jgi:hypothetical protein
MSGYSQANTGLNTLHSDYSTANSILTNVAKYANRLTGARTGVVMVFESVAASGTLYTVPADRVFRLLSATARATSTALATAEASVRTDAGAGDQPLLCGASRASGDTLSAYGSVAPNISLPAGCRVIATIAGVGECTVVGMETAAEA